MGKEFRRAMFIERPKPITSPSMLGMKGEISTPGPKTEYHPEGFVGG